MLTERGAGNASIARRVTGLVCLALLGLVGWRVLSLGMADRLALERPDSALAWRAGHPQALLARAEALARDPAQTEAAAELARQALRADPIDGRGYRVLGQLADRAGDTDKAAELFALAVSRTPRDVPTQTWLASHHLRRGDAAAALVHLDSLFRTSPRLSRQLLPALLAMAAAPQAQPALEESLAARPPWRREVLVSIIQQSPDVDAIFPLIARLRATAPGLAPAEEAAWLDRLMREKRWPQAYLTWVGSLPPDRLKTLGNVFNGGFEFEPSQSGFDWRFGKVVGALVSREPVEGATGSMALRLRFQDRRVKFDHVRQLLALAPGRYRLSGRFRPEQLENERGLVWSVHCAPAGPPLGETEGLRGDGPWRDFGADFEVPAQGCGGQQLVLKLPARGPAEERVRGEVWFDDLRIVRSAAGPGIPVR
ncbi:tetratricopeptide repeat protein [Arenimonas sp. MALMAid1274]|uniref:tetratricopeptide repeat protein n=1 Tax=Arenimonas sp. MALMAid1274 TaxID=3411630 RepID=UPI003B9E7270